MNRQEALAAFAAHKPMLERHGIHLGNVNMYLTEDMKHDFNLALDALPTTFTDANSAVPAILTTMIDPQVVKILFAPTKAAEIWGEQKKGTWLDDTMMFPVVEETGEVSSYGDYSENGRAGVNANWPVRQSYLFQTIVEYGDREVERADLGKINFVASTEAAAANVMNRFTNFSYFFGIAGIANYGILNDPGLGTPISPSIKAAGGVKWVTNNAITATANEVYADIQALFLQLVTQTAGLVDQETPMVLTVSPQAEVALTATNSFNVSVTDLLKKNFPNIQILTAVQYGAQSATNPQGVMGGNVAQLIAKSIEGQDTGYVAYNERMRAHPPVRGTSSLKQKWTGGTWGFINKMPMAIAQMLGI